MMKRWQKLSIVLAVLVLAGLTSCTSVSSGGNGNQATVGRGNITLTVSGSGRLATQQEASLSFRTAGKIAEIVYEEGASVTKGEALAHLEKDSLLLAKKQAEVNLLAAESSLVQARHSHELGLLNARINLETAQYNLDQTQSKYTLKELEAAQADVILVQRDLDEVLRTLSKYDEGTPGYEEYQRTVVFAQTRLNAAKDKVDAILSGSDTEEVAIKRKQVEAAELTLTDAEDESSINHAEKAVELARESLELAKKNLEESTITAPFDGVISQVKADKGDLVDAAMPVVGIVNPTLLELIVEIDEIDVPKVVEGQVVNIGVDAFPDAEFTGKVVSIYPTPASTTGLVVYDVKIVFTAPEESGLKIGMRATADIVVDEASNVIKVPGQAVKEDENGHQYVNVLVEKKTEKRQVSIGVDNGDETEITGGLEEGETVVY